MGRAGSCGHVRFFDLIIALLVLGSWFLAARYSISNMVAPVAIMFGWTLPAVATTVAAAVSTSWYAPNVTAINDLNKVLNSVGVYGFIFNSSVTPDQLYGQYNWRNMPHVRKSEYVRAPKEYELVYVEVVGVLFLVPCPLVWRRGGLSSFAHVDSTASQEDPLPGEHFSGRRVCMEL